MPPGHEVFGDVDPFVFVGNGTIAARPGQMITQPPVVFLDDRYGVSVGIWAAVLLS